MRVGVSGSWPLIFDDEFNATSLDASRWSTGWFGSGITQGVNSYELDCYDPGQVSEGGGELDLALVARAESCGGAAEPYSSGLVNPDGKFSSPTASTRPACGLPAAVNGQIANWPTVWA